MVGGRCVRLVEGQYAAMSGRSVGDTFVGSHPGAQRESIRARRSPVRSAERLREAVDYPHLLFIGSRQSPLRVLDRSAPRQPSFLQIDMFTTRSLQ